jgi:hypothetical protein
MSRTLIKAARPQPAEERVRIESVLTQLGDKSFAWAALFFALINLIPAPPGANLLTAPPLLIVTAQMALGATHLRLPAFITRRTIPSRAVRQAVVRLRPLIAMVERVLRERHVFLFTPRNERLIGVALFAVAVALLIPLPLTGAFPAWATIITALGLLERDGAVTIAGLVAGAASIIVTVFVVGAVIAGVETLI